MNKGMWRTQAGEEIAVKDMGDRHLLNSIAMLERNAPQQLNSLITEGYKALSFVQGEQAEWDIEHDINRLEEMTPQEFLEEFVPIYKTMKWHAQRRKLEVKA